MKYMDAEKREEWDMMLDQPIDGRASASSAFTQEQEADSFMSAMTTLKRG